MRGHERTCVQLNITNSMVEIGGGLSECANGSVYIEPVYRRYAQSMLQKASMMNYATRSNERGKFSEGTHACA